MAGHLPDPEKQPCAPPNETATPSARYGTSSSTLQGDSPDKDERPESRPQSAATTLSHSHPDSPSPSHSSSSLDSDPLSPLERALGEPIASADIEPDEPGEPDEPAANSPLGLNLTRTRTSIASSASRPPEYEVTLEPDDPENPRNWYVRAPPSPAPRKGRRLTPTLLAQGRSGTAPGPS